MGQAKSDAAFGLDKPLLDLQLVTAAGPVHFKVAAVAETAKKDEYVAKVSNSPFYVMVHGYEIKGLLDASLAQLLVDRDNAPAGKQ